jgi:dihydroflavonol-4-reductase
MPDVDGTALITGASGFVGSHLVDHLLSKGVPVRALLRGASSTRWLPDHHDLLQTHRASLHDSAAIEKALAGVTTVYHLAAVTSAPRRSDYFDANVGGTKTLLAAVKQHAPEATFVLCSSQAAAGPSRGGVPLTEKDEPHPQGPYGESKLAAERATLQSGLNTVIIRPPTVYGPRDRDILEMFRWAARGLAPLVGSHEQRLSIVHVEDLVAAFAGAPRARSGAVYFITDGRTYTRDELLIAIDKAVSRESRRIHIPIPLAMSFAHVSRVAARIARFKPLLTPERIRDFCAINWTCDDSLARRELGYESRIGIDAGMALTADWYREQGWI